MYLKITKKNNSSEIIFSIFSFHYEKVTNEQL